MTVVVVQQAAPPVVVVSSPVEPMAVVIGVQGPPAADSTPTLTIDPQAGNRLTTSEAGLFVPPVAEGDLPDMTLIFDNALV